MLYFFEFAVNKGLGRYHVHRVGSWGRWEFIQPPLFCTGVPFSALLYPSYAIWQISPTGKLKQVTLRKGDSVVIKIVIHAVVKIEIMLKFLISVINILWVIFGWPFFIARIVKRMINDYA